jgi:ATP-binding cassette, subfamily B, multidrug efflux pump
MADTYTDDEIYGKAYDARLARRLLRYLVPYRRTMTVSLALLVALGLLELAGPYLMKVAIDQYIAPGNPDGLGFIALLYVGSLVGVFVLRYGQTYLLNATGQRAMHDLRMELFAHLQRMGLRFFDRNPVGALMTRLTNDIEALNEALTSGIVAILGDVITMIGISIVMILLDWRLALVTFLVLPLLYVVSNRLQVRLRDAYRNIRTRLSRLNVYVQESVSGMAIIQLFNREQRSFERFDALNADYLHASLRSVFLFSVLYPSVTVIGSLAIAAIIWYGGGQALQGALTIGVLVAFLQYLQRFYEPIRDMAEKYNIMQQAMTSAERIFGLLDEPEEVRNPEAPVHLPNPRGEVVFDHVWFAYQDEDWVLKDVTFRIAPGESIAFVGATGAGKTSLISLLARFYDPQRGRILVDGVDLRDLDQAELRRHLGVVLQDPFLFAGTVEQNIRLQNAAIGAADVRAAAQRVGADRFIERLPGGYQHEVRERGGGLSVGQKQLLAFARAIAHNPRILLVLDEATSSVDTETEALIGEALREVMRDRTTLAIAHRLATVQHVDRIIVLHKGRTVEQGSHAELLAQRGLYYRLWELQRHDSLLRSA